MKYLLAVLFTLSMVLGIFAQENQQRPAEPGRIEVTGVRLIRDGANNLSLVVSGNPVSCGPVVIEQFLQNYTSYTAGGEIETSGKITEVILSTAPLEKDETCNTFAPFQQRVDLIGTYEFDQDLILLVNDFAAWIYLGQPGGMILDLPMQVVDVGEQDLARWYKNDFSINTVDWDTTGDTIHASLAATYPVSCVHAPLSRSIPDRLDAQAYRVELFGLQPADLVCESNVAEFSAMVDTALPSSMPALIQIEPDLFKYDPDATGDPFAPVVRRWATVESVEIREDQGFYQIEVQGNQNGSCNAPLQEMVMTGPDHSLISIFDVVPVVAPCTSDIRGFHNSFIVDSIPVIINGRVYDEVNAQLEPTVPAEEGATMQVDTVIEDVEVMVLESFPMQLHLQVSGYQSDGCDFPVQVEQQVDGNDVSVHIFREVPADTMCPMNIVAYEDNIVIDGGFTGGTVTIQVNEQTVTVDL